MDRKKVEKAINRVTRRNFLHTVGVGVPTMNVMLKKDASGGQRQLERSYAQTISRKFTPVDLDRYFNASPKDFGPREQAKALGGDSARDGLIRLPAGSQNLRGIPFLLGPEGVGSKSWIVLSTRAHAWMTASTEIPLQAMAHYVCLAGFCDWDQNETPPPGKDVIENVGQHLGDAVLVQADGAEHVVPIRRRFEVNSPTLGAWGHLSFASVPHRKNAPRKLTDPLTNGLDWGQLQTSVKDNAYSPGTLWVSSLANPHPDRLLRSIRFEAKAEEPLVICGMTLFQRPENPLRYKRLSLYRFTLPEPTPGEENRWAIDVDLGVIGRTFVLSDFEPDAWLSSSGIGLGEESKLTRGSRFLYAEVAASPAATLVLTDLKTGHRFEFDLSRAVGRMQVEARPGGAHVEILESEKVWLRGQIVDAPLDAPLQFGWHSARRKVAISRLMVTAPKSIMSFFRITVLT